MRVDVENYDNQTVVRVGDILMYNNYDEVIYYLITSLKSSSKHLNSTDSYVLYSLNGNSVWNIQGNTKSDILKLINTKKMTHYSQEDFKLNIVKINK